MAADKAEYRFKKEDIIEKTWKQYANAHGICTSSRLHYLPRNVRTNLFYRLILGICKVVKQWGHVMGGLGGFQRMWQNVRVTKLTT